jgi:hypothetical protein
MALGSVCAALLGSLPFDDHTFTTPVYGYRVRTLLVGMCWERQTALQVMAPYMRFVMAVAMRDAPVFRARHAPTFEDGGCKPLGYSSESADAAHHVG